MKDRQDNHTGAPDGAPVSSHSEDVELFSKPDETALEHVIAATGYSLAGGRVALRQPAVRMEIVVWAAILVLFFVVGAPGWAYLASIVLFAALLSVEALNTAIEFIVDQISPEKSDFARDTKDLASFAIFCLLCAHGILSLYVLFTAIF